MQNFQFEALIEAAEIGGKGGAYVRVPFDIRALFGKGRVAVHARFDGVPYEGSIVNMGLKNRDGSVCYILGIRKDMQKQIHKTIGDTVSVTITERTQAEPARAKSGTSAGATPRFEQTGAKRSKADSIDAYIAEQIPEVQPLLQKIRGIIRSAAPEAVEKISWSMPTFWQGENLIHFAAFKKHIGLYPGGELVEVFSERLKDYKTSKGAIQLPLDRPIDEALIRDMVHWRLQQRAGAETEV